MKISYLEPFSIEEIVCTAPDQVKVKLLDLVNKYRDCFSKNLSQIGRTKNHQMTIKLNNETPVTYRPYRIAFKERDEVNGILQELLDSEIIRNSESEFSSPLVIVKKKDGSKRICVDYRGLNKITIKDKYPLPLIEDTVAKLEGFTYFTSLDLYSGYYQIPLNEESKSKTAFITQDGHYEFNVVPFGLTNAPAIFQRMINSITKKIKPEIALAYMDDIIIPSRTFEEGIERLKILLTSFREAGLTLNIKKCKFFMENIDYLGYEISKNGIKPSNIKIIAVKNFKKPENVHEIRQFLGLTSYFRKFVYNFALIAEPLTRLTRKDVPFKWEAQQEQAFGNLKNELCKRPILSLFSTKFKTEVHTDASAEGLGGILLQWQDEKNLKPVAFFSRQTSKEESKYHSYELETLAIVETLKRFRVYLIGIHFKVITDCNSVRSTLSKKDLVPRIARWWLQIQEYDFEIDYRPGTAMSHVDALSRNAIVNSDEQVIVIKIDDWDWVVVAQSQDNKIRDIKNILKNGAVTKDEKRIFREFKLDKDKVYRKINDDYKLVVPKKYRAQILKAFHDELGHFSFDKTSKKISEYFWFAGLRHYVKRYVGSCLQCMYNKVPSGKQAGFLHPIEKIGVPMHTVHIDHLGPFVKSPRGKSYLIVAIDAFTKFVFLKATVNTKVAGVLTFLNEIFGTFGVPVRLICDRGSAFTSKAFEAFCKDKNIKRILNATATPRANGQCERFNRSILNSLMTSIKDERDWDRKVDTVKWAINNVPNDTTGKSAYELMFGIKGRGQNSTFLIEPQSDRDDQVEIRNEALKITQLKQVKMKEHFDKKRKSCKFEPNDLVLVRKNKVSNDGQSKKLMPRFEGPYRVEKCLGNDRYLLKDIDGAQRSQTPYTGVHAIDSLKKFQLSEESDISSSEESDADEPRVVEQLNAEESENNY